MTFTSLALDGASFAHRFELTFQPPDSLLDSTAIYFQLCFAGPTGPNSSGLARKMMPHSGQPRQKILQLGELDLETAFTAARALRKNIEDQLSAIEHFA